jgi:hypothetical protein
MTPGNNGASTPEDDDPFGYLYADGQARGAQPPTGSYGYPNAVNRVRPVGERQYGQQTQQPSAAQQAPTSAYGQFPQQNGYGQPNAHYQAPESFSGGAETTRQQSYGSGGGGGRGRGPNTKGLLIGAIAVVAAVVIGIGVAMIGGDDKADDNAGGPSTTPTADQNTEPSPSTTKKTEQKPGELPKAEAKTLQLGGNATVASDIPGAKSEGGFYVTGFNQVGSKVTWSFSGIKKAGAYRLYVRYGIPGVDADATLLVNGKTNTQPLGMKNFINSPKGDFEKGWQTTWAPVTLNKGTNQIEIVCGEGNKCDANIDQLYLVNP